MFSLRNGFNEESQDMFFLRMQDGSNEGSHDMFLWRTVENYPLIIHPCYPFLSGALIKS